MLNCHLISSAVFQDGEQWPLPNHSNTEDYFIDSYAQQPRANIQPHVFHLQMGIRIHSTKVSGITVPLHFIKYINNIYKYIKRFGRQHFEMLQFKSDKNLGRSTQA